MAFFCKQRLVLFARWYSSDPQFPLLCPRHLLAADSRTIRQSPLANLVRPRLPTAKCDGHAGRPARPTSTAQQHACTGRSCRCTSTLSPPVRDHPLPTWPASLLQLERCLCFPSSCFRLRKETRARRGLPLRLARECSWRRHGSRTSQALCWRRCPGRSPSAERQEGHECGREPRCLYAPSIAG